MQILKVGLKVSPLARNSNPRRDTLVVNKRLFSFWGQECIIHLTLPTIKVPENKPGQKVTKKARRWCIYSKPRKGTMPTCRRRSTLLQWIFYASFLWVFFPLEWNESYDGPFPLLYRLCNNYPPPTQTHKQGAGIFHDDARGAKCCIHRQYFHTMTCALNLPQFLFVAMSLASEPFNSS